MHDVATLLQAISSLLWPIFAFTALLIFRTQIIDLAQRLKKGKVLGQEIELSESLDKLGKVAESVQTEVAALSGPAIATKSPDAQASEIDVVRKIIAEAALSPKAALITLAGELERLAINILATSGHLNGRTFVPIQQAIGELHQTYGLPAHVPSSLQHFWEVRNRLIHGGEGTDEDILRAIDSGISILKSLQAMPGEVNIVFDPDVALYSAPDLNNQIEHVHGVLLETKSPSGVSTSYRILPSSRRNFKKGKQVSWEWNMNLVIGPAWYRDPMNDQIKSAWNSSAEFVGRHLDEL